MLQCLLSESRLILGHGEIGTIVSGKQRDDRVQMRATLLLSVMLRETRRRADVYLASVHIITAILHRAHAYMGTKLSLKDGHSLPRTLPVPNTYGLNAFKDKSGGKWHHEAVTYREQHCVRCCRVIHNRKKADQGGM